MKKVTAALVLAAILQGAHPAAADEGGPTRVEIPVEALLAPITGFEEKNVIQVVLYGYLPNSCYTLSDSTVERVSDSTFEVRQFALHDTGGMCADEASMPAHARMIVPFTQEVSIGHLAAGTYRFEWSKSGDGHPVRTLVVSHNVSPTTDTLPYAAVSAAKAQDVISSLQPVVVTLSGVLNSTCTHLNKQVRVIHEDDVLVLLPTVRVDTGVMCGQVMIPFETRIDLGPLPPGIRLIHVRSMNGRAVNKVINVMK
jgi:hypothetical protein